jgi:hypothetical protein
MFAASKTDSVSGATADAQFNYVTMLLHGDGTNGAQNNTFVDSSSNNFSITRNGNTTQGSFSPYGSNWSNYFAYNSTAANYLTTSSVSLSGTFTIEGYVYWDGVGSNANMFTLGDSSLSTGLEVYISGGNWVMWSNAAQRIAGSAAVVGQWTYISISRTGSTVTMYINGASQGTWTSSATFSGTIKVGAEFYSGVYYSSMSGYISNFRVNNTTAINAVPTTPLTAVSGTIFLTCQSNRFIDNSASPLTITVNGTPSVQRFNPFGTTTAYSTSVIGGSGYFDGSGDYLQVANNSAFDFSGDFTVECWLYLENTNNQTFISKGGHNALGPDAAGWALFIYTGQGLRFMTRNSGGTNVPVTVASTPQINTWMHVAVSRSGSSMRSFLNGTLVSTVTSSVNTANSSPFNIGANLNNLSPSTGYICDVRIIKGTAQYTATFTPPTAPLTAITDTQFLENFTNGAIFDNAMMNDLETLDNAQISTSVKKFGTGSLAFDGSDWLKAPNSPNYDMRDGDFTIEGWYYQTADGGQICCKYEAGNQASWAIGFSGSSWDVYTYYSTTSYLTIYTGSAPAKNQWNHFALERNGSNIEFYVNGSRVAQVAAQTMRTTTSAVSIGNLGQGYSSFFTGYIDDLRITKGYARYSGTTYTMPTAAFSDTGPY